MGIAIDAGFYECVALADHLSMQPVLPRWKNYTVEHARNMNIYVEYESVENLKRITDKSYRSLCRKTIIYHCYSPRKPKLPGRMV